ncbi:MAG: hypothetical protein GWN10_23675, partial [Nitrospinaceae bacterium]|nr:hypothetical protein [Nitrospinaceae bacterium]NIR57423.1 hypothetical protein [Nitrospinaceae bacterium]NIS87881.1 hypothetical protein [Nitrospinaceae bacterium]NIU46926.1 hypothetical protein [Nitrospinaceae bacterium]NIU99127.1 hypothetical protein [Nitrospinaceae bacterium]
RTDATRPFSDHGMQLDSHINKMVFALQHLCRTAQGIPVDSLALKVLERIDQDGKKGAREKFIALGNPPADVDLWIEHAEYYRQNEERHLDYGRISALIDRAASYIELYEDLMRREVDDKTKDTFLSDAKTLLVEVKKFLGKKEYLVMALNEDKDRPFLSDNLKY